MAVGGCPSLSLKFVSAANLAPQHLWAVMFANEVIVSSLALLMGAHFFDFAVAKVITASLLSAGGVTLNNSYRVLAIILAKLSSFLLFHLAPSLESFWLFALLFL